jgi:hypothetical protein
LNSPLRNQAAKNRAFCPNSQAAARKTGNWLSSKGLLDNITWIWTSPIKTWWMQQQKQGHEINSACEESTTGVWHLERACGICNGRVESGTDNGHVELTTGVWN